MPFACLNFGVVAVWVFVLTVTVVIAVCDFFLVVV